MARGSPWGIVDGGAALLRLEGAEVSDEGRCDAQDWGCRECQLGKVLWALTDVCYLPCGELGGASGIRRESMGVARSVGQENHAGIMHAVMLTGRAFLVLRCFRKRKRAREMRSCDEFFAAAADTLCVQFVEADSLAKWHLHSANLHAPGQ